MWLRSLYRLSSCLVVVLVLLVSAATAQQPPAKKRQPKAKAKQEQQQPVAEPQPEASEAPAETTAESPPAEAIPEGIELMPGSGYTYDARGRRDPFVSLALGVSILRPEDRPRGLPGMLIQEVSLHGIVKTADGFIAMIQGTDNKSYFARAGERLYDGVIEAIEPGRVIFRQEINDPLRVEKFHRIEKWLHPVEEGKR